VDEEIDRILLAHAASLGKAERVDAQELLVSRLPHEVPEAPNDTRREAAALRDGSQALVEERRLHGAAC
jgi:hypothetical protein